MDIVISHRGQFVVALLALLLNSCLILISHVFSLSSQVVMTLVITIVLIHCYYIPRSSVRPTT